MLSNLIWTTRSLLQCARRQLFVQWSTKPLQTAFNSSATIQDNTPVPPVVDIDMDVLFEDSDGEFQPDISGLEETDVPLKSTTLDGAPVAPVDINPWVDQEEEKQGTVELEQIEDSKPITYPPIPNDRLGSYEFKGIKVVLPKKMLRPETYRYRLDTEDLAKLADDICVCKFDK